MSARKLNCALAEHGKLESDGRPPLKLDSRDLLDIVRNTHPDAFLIPAHIWTPWFAALGSKSGFDSIEECYGDLAKHIFALETGLSSDPSMNARMFQLDRFQMVSNSDDHSPQKIGREANVFDTAMNYLETGFGFGGIIEFFPEEGKYHLDGHRKCGIRLTPAETERLNGKCPTCGKPVTVGVLNHIHELADRPVDHALSTEQTFESIISLPETLSEFHGVGAKTNRVQSSFDRLLNEVGPEFHILGDASVNEIEQASSDTLAEAIRRMRAKQIIRNPGFDGEYGTVKLFEPGEI